MNQEEIQKRIETAQARYKARMAPMLEKKKKNKELAQKLLKEGAVLAYFDLDYCRMKTCSPGTITLTTKVSVAAKQVETETEGKVKFVIVYAILSEHDNFNKSTARELLAARLEDPKAKQRIIIEVTEKAVNNSEKMHDIMWKAMELELASNTSTVPAWLYNGLHLHQEVYGNDIDLF